MVSTPRERRQQRTRQAILDAARQIIAREGAAALSMRELAQRIDYSPAAIYEYFGSKDEILEAVTVEGHARLMAAMQQVDESLAARVYLLELGLAYIRFAMRNPDYYLLMFTSCPSGATMERMMQGGSSFPLLVGAIRRGLDEGAFLTRPDFGLMEMAYAAWATVHGVAMLRLTYLQEIPLQFDTADREILLNFGRGLEVA
jgi:AcrR family transcriptional regulator